MAYSQDNLQLVVDNTGKSGAGKIWQYVTTDAANDVCAADYFTDGGLMGMSVGDKVIIVNTSAEFCTEATVTNVASDDDDVTVNVDAGRRQTLTATAAITAGVTIIDLNHASVVIAATVADAGIYAGKVMVITNTSASGTAAHTVTLTAGGTFDGTNTVATLNAPGEKLAVIFDNDGNGTVIANTGSVGLS